MRVRAWRPIAAVLAGLTIAMPARSLAQAPDSGSAPAAPAPAIESFPVTLGSFATTLIGSLPARTANIQLSVRAIDGTVLLPGEQFSFNDIVGERSAARGYQRAPVILHEARQMQLGGGICQVASTLFVAALLSGLSVAERHRHSFPVDYIALAEDATIAWGVKDLRIRNDLDQPVRLRVQVLGMTLSARIEAEAGLAETFDLETIEREAPSADDALPAREIELYRLRRVGGELVDRELVHRDVYPPTMARLPEPRGAAPR
jgi:vancomycin resistance protein YoaR